LVKYVKDGEGQVKTEYLMSVRYGDLVVPSEAEIREAHRELERGENKIPRKFSNLCRKSINNCDSAFCLSTRFYEIVK
jgi:hypothetical protein